MGTARQRLPRWYARSRNGRGARQWRVSHGSCAGAARARKCCPSWFDVRSSSRSTIGSSRPSRTGSPTSSSRSSRASCNTAGARRHSTRVGEGRWANGARAVRSPPSSNHRTAPRALGRRCRCRPAASSSVPPRVEASTRFVHQNLGWRRCVTNLISVQQQFQTIRGTQNASIHTPRLHRGICRGLLHDLRQLRNCGHHRHERRRDGRQHDPRPGGDRNGQGVAGRR